MKFMQPLYHARFYQAIILLWGVSVFYGICLTAHTPDPDTRRLPTGPRGSAAFGAYSTRLNDTPQWERQWPVSEVADVVVRFDDQEPRFVFWRGTSYIPCWATYDGAWFTNEFFERRGGAESGTVSMVEPMSDKQCRYSHVRILENTDARVVIHWRYAPTDLEYSMAFMDEESHWGDWADEVYYLYPDAVGTRKATLFTSAPDEWIEYQESIVINPPGTMPDDNLSLAAVTLLNLQGDSRTFVWGEQGGPEFDHLPANVCIQRINLKTADKPFTIVPPDEVGIESYGGQAPGSHFNVWDHWPVSQVKSHTRVGTSAENPSHTSLSHLTWQPFAQDEQSKTWIMLHGMTEADDNALVSLAKSWIQPPDLQLQSDDFSYKGYDAAQRAFIVECTKSDKPSSLNLKLSAGPEQPLVNPAFVIQGWGRSGVSIKKDGKTLENGNTVRVGHVSGADGVDLIIWLCLQSDNPVTLQFSRITT